jgi:hypothetical protein
MLPSTCIGVTIATMLPANISSCSINDGAGDVTGHR